MKILLSRWKYRILRHVQALLVPNCTLPVIPKQPLFICKYPSKGVVSSIEIQIDMWLIMMTFFSLLIPPQKCYLSAFIYIIHCIAF